MKNSEHFLPTVSAGFRREKNTYVLVKLNIFLRHTQNPKLLNVNSTIILAHIAKCNIVIPTYYYVCCKLLIILTLMRYRHYFFNRKIDIEKLRCLFDRSIKLQLVKTIISFILTIVCIQLVNWNVINYTCRVQIPWEIDCKTKTVQENVMTTNCSSQNNKLLFIFFFFFFLRPTHEQCKFWTILKKKKKS